MTSGFNGIITELEKQKTAIDKALAALRMIEGGETAAEPTAESTPNAPAARRGRMSPAGKRRLIAALKKRWAAKKAAANAAAAPAKAAPSSGRISEEGRKRLAEAMKRRWAVKRAGSSVKKVGRTKTA